MAPAYFIKKSRNDGNALLVALILMGVLMTLSLGISDLIIRAVSDNRTLLETAQARYAAESGLEKALKIFAETPPGFEASETVTLPNARYAYGLEAADTQIPPKTEATSGSEEDTYASLMLNESVTIPLFRGSEPSDSISAFRVDFYVPVEFRDGTEGILESLDLLRWKIFGIARDDGQMEVLNEFLPMEVGRTTAQQPTCLGTSNDCWNGAKFYERDAVTKEFRLVEKYPIETFLQNHTQNFLVLTNTINTDLFPEIYLPEEKAKKAVIRYRVKQENDVDVAKLTLPLARITSDGFAGESKQSLDVKVARETFLPVFNYALYRTKEE